MAQIPRTSWKGHQDLQPWVRVQSTGTLVTALCWFLWNVSQAVGLAITTLLKKMILVREIVSGERQEAGERGVSRESPSQQLVGRRSPAGKAGTAETGRSSNLQPRMGKGPHCLLGNGLWGENLSQRGRESSCPHLSPAQPSPYLPGL